MAVSFFNHITNLATEVHTLEVPNPPADPSVIQNVIQISLAVAGALALLFLIVSGLRLITSSGNPEQVKKAKNGIVYSLVGLVVIILAEVIVGFVMRLLV